MFLIKKKKEIKRRIFGFPCDTHLIMILKAVIAQIPSPIYPAMEHLCQLGCSAFLYALQDEQSRKNLEEHILKEHMLVPSIVTDSAYDIKMIAESKRLEIRRQQFEEFTRDFMKVCDEEDIEPEVLLIAARSMLDALRERRRQHDDIPRRWPTDPTTQ